MTTQAATIDLFNGVNFAQFTDTIDAIKANPALARVTIRAEVEWSNGAQVQTKIHRCGNDTQAIAPLIFFENGERSVPLNGETAVNAMEIILAGLGSCLIMSFFYHATQRGFRVDELGLRLEAEIDLRGFLGLSPQVRPGYRIVRLAARARCDAPGQALEELWQHVQKISPVLDIIRNPVPVTIELEETN